MTKYMTKQLHDGDLFERGERRFGFSRHQPFKTIKISYMAQPPHIQFGAHFNQESKYWPEIKDKYVAQAGIHAIQYFEAKTISPQGLKNILQGPSYLARKIITLIQNDIPLFSIFKDKELIERLKNRENWAESGDLKPNNRIKRHRAIYKHYKPKHNKSNITF